MYQKLIATVIFAIVINPMSEGKAEEFNREFNFSDLEIIFSDTTVEWINPKGIKIALTLNSDGSAKLLAVSEQQKIRRKGQWWTKAPNIHCVKWIDRKKDICRPIGIIKKGEGALSTNVKGMTWTITKDKVQMHLTQGGSVEDFQKKAAVEIRKTLPQKLNGLTLVNVNTQGKTFQYIYELDQKLNEIPKPDLDAWKTAAKGQVIPQICKSNLGKYIRDHEVVYQYTYLSKDKLPVLDFNISENSCF